MPNKPFRSGSEGTYASAIKGLIQGVQMRREIEQMAADRALKQQAADIQARQQKASEAELGLKVLQAQQGSIIQTPSGQTLAIPGLQGVNYDPATLSLSKGAGFSAGTRPGAVKTPPVSPVESKLAKEIATAQASLAETRPLVNTAVNDISRVEELNKNSYGGLAGSATMAVKSALNKGKDDQKFKNTSDIVNTMQGMVSRVLKSTFGGQLSDGERAYLNEVYGAVKGMSQTERAIAMKNVKNMLSGKLQIAESKYSELTGGVPPQASAPATGQKDKYGYVIGQTYTMKDGNTATYSGNGVFE